MEIQHLVYCPKEECDVDAEDCDECEFCRDRTYYEVICVYGDDEDE